jgi:hypothetical protein
MASTDDGCTFHLHDFKADSHFLGEPQDLSGDRPAAMADVVEQCCATVGVNLQVPYLKLFAGNASIRAFQLSPQFILHNFTILLILSP